MVEDEPRGKGKRKLESAETEAAPDNLDTLPTSSADASSLADEPADRRTGKGTRPPFSSPPKPAPPEHGTSFDRFRILEKLGEGGMGTIYAAVDPDLDRKIAIKLLRPRNRAAEEREAARQRLLREAQAMAKLSHPNVVAVHSVGTTEEHVYVAMELVDGRTLREWREAEPRTWREVVDTFRLAGRGLAAAHEAGLVHRDFKPENVLVGNDGRVLVTDFGLVSTSGADVSSHAGSTRDSAELSPTTPLSASLTRTGSLLGTPIYMAPEQHERKKSDARTDQYSFCVALYEALYGRRPFTASSYAELAHMVCSGRAPAPPADSDVPAWLRTIVMRGLERDPERRFPSMAALLAELGRDPEAERRRRRRGIATATVLVALASVAAFTLLRRGSSTDTRCKAGAAELAQVWGPTRKAAVEKAFVATGRPYAEDVYARVSKRLDGFARAWTAAHADACRATHERGVQSEVALDLRMRCLGRRLGEANALIDLFAEKPDTEVLDHAIQAASRLGGLEACADVDDLSEKPLPPADPAARDRVAAIGVRLDRARALGEAGKYQEGLAIAIEASKEASTTDYAPIEARARFRLASLRASTGDAATADTEFRLALDAAAAAHDDHLAAEASIELFWIVGYELARHHEAMQLESAARVAVARAGANAWLRAKLDNHVGDLRRAQGKYEEARASYREALAILEQELGPDDPNLADSVNRLGAIASILGEFDEAWQSYERAFAIQESALGPDHPTVAGYLGNLGVVLVKQGKLEQARPYYDRSLATRERSLGPDHPDVALSLHNLSTLTLQQGKLDEAYAFAERALAICERAYGPRHPDVADALEALGNVAWHRGELEKATEYFRRSLSILEEKLGRDHPSTAHTANNLGGVLATQGKYDEASVYLEHSLAAKEKALPAGHPSIAYSLYNMGELREKQGRPADAISYFERALEIWEKAFGDRNPDVADARFALARNLWDARRERKRSIALARDALAIYEEAGNSRKQEAAKARAWLRKRAGSGN